MATTKTDPKLALAANGAKKHKVYEGLTRDQLIQAYRFMYTSRRIDDREILLKRQQKIFFQMSGAGHEAIGVAAGVALATNVDVVVPFLEHLLHVHIMDDPDVYYISGLPSETHGADVALIAAAAMLLTLLATIYPAIKASKTQPAEALRYE